MVMVMISRKQTRVFRYLRYNRQELNSPMSANNIVITIGLTRHKEHSPLLVATTSPPSLELGLGEKDYKTVNGSGKKTHPHI